MTIELKDSTKWDKFLCDSDYLLHHIGDYEWRVKPQPTYRPYANAEEFLKASKEHGSYIEFHNGLYEVPTLNKIGKSEPWRICVNTPAYNGLSLEEILKFKWQDGTPCGILEQ